MKIKKWVVFSLFAALIGFANGDVLTATASGWDRSWFENGSTANGLNERVGSLTTNGGGRNGSLVFLLPALAAGESIVSAELTVELTAVKNTPTFNVDLYGVSFTPQGTEPGREYYEGVFQSSENGNVGLIDDFVSSSDATGSYSSTGSQSVSIGTWIQSFYTANPAYSGGTMGVFRLSPDADSGLVDVGFDFASVDNNTAAFRPTLTLTTAIPEPTTLGLVAAFGGAVLIIRRRFMI